MKFQTYFIIALLSVVFLSCEDDITNVGTRIRPAGDTIIVNAKSFALSSENYAVPYMYSRPDSLLLGKFTDNISGTGTTCGDIFAQFQPPVDFSYPEGSVADSVKLIVYYYSWFGDTYSPMKVNIYEMNQGNIFNFSSAYKTNLNPDDFVDPNNKILIGSRIFTAKDAVEDIARENSSSLEFTLSTDFLNRFTNNVLNRTFTDNPTDLVNNVSKFQELFNGMYITTDFGSASMLYIRTMNMRFYFHYNYTAEGDTEPTEVNTYVNYPANKEVRQINRFFHPEKDAVKAKFDADKDVNLISSPGNIYTKVNIPLASILKDSLDVNDKKLLINAANLRVDAVDVQDTTLAQPLASTLLLIKESAYERFFSTRELPTDTCAILSSVAFELNENGDDYDYYYSFSLAKLISTQYRDNGETLTDNFKMVLVPVKVEYDDSRYVIQVTQQNIMSTTKICSGTNQDNPMKLKVIYSGF